MAQNHLGQDHFLLLSWIKRIGFVVILQMIVNIQSSTSIYQNGCCRPWSYQTNLQSMMYVQSKICSFFEMMFHLYSRSHSPASLMCLLQNVGWHIHCIMKFTWFQTGLLTHWFMIAPSTEVKHLKWSPKWNSKYVICSSGCINTWGSRMQHGSFLPIQIPDIQTSRPMYMDFSQYGTRLIRF